MAEFIHHPVLLWLLAAAVFAIAEVSLPSFSFLFLATAGLLTAITSIWIASWEIQLGIFGFMTLLGLLFLRPKLIQKVQKKARGVPSRGQAESRIKVAQAEFQAIRLISEALGSTGNPSGYLIAQKYLESLNQIAANADKTVFLPYEATAAMGALGAMKELLAKNQA